MIDSPIGACPKLQTAPFSIRGTLSAIIPAKSHDPSGRISMANTHSWIHAHSGTADLKQTDYQIFLYQSWGFFGMRRDFIQFRVCNHVNRVHVPARQQKERAFIERKRELRGPEQTESIALHRLRPCQGAGRVFLLPLGSAASQRVRFPPFGLPTM